MKKPFKLLPIGLIVSIIFFVQCSKNDEVPKIINEDKISQNLKQYAEDFFKASLNIDEEFVIDEIGEPLEIITPRNKSERGCQISIIAHGKGKELFNKLTENGIIADWREPNVIRMAPVPLYNTFEDIFRFGEILKNAL